MSVHFSGMDYESAALTIELRAQTVYLPRFTAFISLSTMPIVTIFLTIERPCHRFLKQPFPARGGHSLKYTVEIASHDSPDGLAICATHRNLRESRRTLFPRRSLLWLSPLPIELPPLRERSEYGNRKTSPCVRDSVNQLRADWLQAVPAALNPRWRY